MPGCNKMTESAFKTIVTNARSFSECYHAGDHSQINQYLENWCQVVAQGKQDVFRKRLQWDGIEINAARFSLNAVVEKETLPETLPAWATTLKDIIATAAQWQSTSGQLSIANDPLPLSVNAEKPLPFEDLLLPLINVARQKLWSQVDLSTRHLLLEQAYLELERSLLISLTSFCDKTLEKEFDHFRPFGYRLFKLMEVKIELEPETTHYQAFVQHLLQDGLLTFFQKYPVLGKLIATRIDFWVESTTEFLQRLETDIPAIQQMFQPGREENSGAYPLGKVAEVKPSLSDPHRRGRCVVGLTFESGLKLIYKPKSLGLDSAYQQLLEWFNQQNVPLDFKTLKVLDRSNYGWVEYVEQLPVEDESAARRFYQRSGMLLCLFYVLNTTDCHYENLIACGEHWVLIDMETLMHPDARDMAVRDINESSEKQLQKTDQPSNESVLRSGLLPQWDFNKNNPVPYDISGLGSIDADAAISDRVLVWKLINTDYMHRTYEVVTLPSEKNVPMLNGMPLSPSKYLDEIVVGFRQMYHFLIQHHEALLAENSPLARFSGQQVRFVFRATKAYAVILHSLLEPEYLQNGCDRSVQLDILSRVFLNCQNQPLAWSILSSELQAMEQSDIPYFAAQSDSDTLTVGLEQPLSGYFKAPCYEQVVYRLLKLEEADLIRQVALIRDSFAARVAPPQSSSSVTPDSIRHIKEPQVV
jgi:type 2 lantibiotic biosynthesis protein LanM